MPSPHHPPPNYISLPAEHRLEMRAYVEDGTPPGPLMECILIGDLFGAFKLSGVTPEEPSQQLLSLIGWVDGQMPAKSFGNVGAVVDWTASGGLNGKARKIRSDIALANAYKAAERSNRNAFRAALAVITGGRA